MKKSFRILLLISFLIIPISYNACSEVRFQGVDQETVAGNPFSSNMASQEILFAICSVLDRCQSQVPFNTCMSGILATNGIGQTLGAAIDPYSSLENAETSGTITSNPTVTNTCTMTINNLSCSDPNVQNAYNTLSPNAFSAVPQMIPGICANVFTPVGWSQIANTALEPDCPNDPTLRGNTGCAAVISGWSGAIADTNQNRMIIWGGGATDYYGNEVYALDLNSQTMSRIINPSPATMCTSKTSDGNPNSRETEDSLAFITSTNQLFEIGGAVACNTGQAIFNDTWTLDLGTLQWKSQDPHTGVSPGTEASSLGNWFDNDYDPVTNKVYVADGNSFFSYDSSSNTYALLNAAPINSYATAVIDPVKHLYIAIGGGQVVAIDINAGSNYVSQNWTAQVSGCGPFMNSTSPGIAYDTAINSVVGWGGGNNLYIFDSGSKTCTIKTFAGGPTPQANGTFGRFRYFPALDEFILVNDWQQNAYRLRLQ